MTKIPSVGVRVVDATLHAYQVEYKKWQIHSYPVVGVTSVRLARYDVPEKPPSDPLKAGTVTYLEYASEKAAESFIRFKAMEAAILEAFKTERIVRAAIRRGKGVWSVAAPGRHRQVFDDMIAAGLSPDELGGPDDQGFITSTGRFVDRVIGRHVALACGQIEKTISSELTTEDLW